MKLVAYSMVPPNPMLYLHLGYTSAAVYERTSHTPGYVFITGGALLAVLFGVILFRKGTSPAARRHGRVLLLAGLIIVGLAQIPWPSRYKYPETATYDSAFKTYQYLQKASTSGSRIPPNLRELARTFPYAKDAWGHEMRVIPNTVNGNKAFAVVSAGQDSKFGTRDDIAVTEGSPPMYSERRLPALTDTEARGK